MNVYAYCLSDHPRDNAFEGIAGIGDKRPALVRFGEMTAVVSEFSGQHVPVTRESVSAHERVIFRLLEQNTLLPFRFGTLISLERLENYVDSNRPALLASLARVHGCVEMSVKIIRNADVVQAETDRQVDRLLGTGPGTAFLLSKRREIAHEEAGKERSDEVTRWLARHLDLLVRESRVRLNPTRTLIVSATFLVERTKLSDYRKRLKLAREERTDLHFLTSGPWPPYSFSVLGY